MKIHVKNAQQHEEFLENYISTSDYFAGACELRLGYIKYVKVFHNVKACFTLVIGAFQKSLSSIL